MGKLEEAIKEFITSFGENLPEQNFAILYAPEKCFLGLADKDGNVEVKDNVDKFNIEKVYEARVFNTEKELRYLEGKPAVILSDADLRKESGFVDVIKQKYLLWGQSTGNSKNGWTEFAEARIGAFFVPVANVAKEGYAQFSAIEYLKEFTDGNVAVFEERLTGITLYSPETKGENENAD